MFMSLQGSPKWLRTKDKEIEGRTQAERNNVMLWLPSKLPAMRDLLGTRRSVFHPCGPNELHNVAMMTQKHGFLQESLPVNVK